MNEDILFYAFRYALGRKSYVVEDVVIEITKHWPTLSNKFKTMVIFRIKEAISNGNAGDWCDMVHWRKVLALEVTK